MKEEKCGHSAKELLNEYEKLIAVKTVGLHNFQLELSCFIM